MNNETKSPTDLLSLFSEKEDYLKVLLGTYGCIHFQDRLKNEFMQTSYKSDDSLQPYLAEFHMTVSLSMYRLWLKRNKDISLDKLSSLIHSLYMNGISGLTHGS